MNSKNDYLYDGFINEVKGALNSGTSGPSTGGEQTHYDLTTYKDIEFSGNIDDYPEQDNSDPTNLYFKVSDDKPNIEDLIGGSLTYTYLDNGKTITELITLDETNCLDYIEQFGLIFIMLESGLTLAAIIHNSEKAGEVMPGISEGIYFVRQAESLYLETTQCLYFPAKKLSPKFIPEVPALQIGNTKITESDLQKLLGRI